MNLWDTICATKALGRPNISHADWIRVLSELSARGRTAFEAPARVVQDESFKEAMAIGTVPSEETVRQRMAPHLASFEEIAEEAMVATTTRPP